MANTLDILLNMEIPSPKEKAFKIKRLSALAGEDVVFQLRELTYSHVGQIKRLHSDDDEMSVHVVLAGTVSPDLKNTALAEKYGAVTPAELVKKMLSPGEIEDLSRAIERLSGYRMSTLEEVKKN